jgi:ATP phosphoribosyltransferase
VNRRLSIAIPSKGRLREPSWSLLEASGLSPQEPGERVLVAHCRNADVDVLFVRADDVPEYVQDRVVDCGITGLDLVAERDCDVEVLLELGFGNCSLQGAVPNEDRAASLGDLDGRRVATAHPRLAARELAELGVKADLVTVTGSAEIAPRLGLADAIVDLVSSGSTLRTNGLRTLGTLFESEAVLIGRGDPASLESSRTLTTVLGSVVNARANRYLLCNVPVDAVDAVTALLPTTGSPSVMPLATPGIVAVHALVPAKEIWQLLPRLEELGANSILTLPVERMVP